MAQRMISAIVGIPIVFAAIWFGEPWYSVLVAAVALLAAIEFYRMAPVKLGMGLTAFGVLWSLLLVVNVHLPASPGAPLLVTSSVIIPLIWLTLRSRTENVSTQWAWTSAGVLYVGWLLSHFVLLRSITSGREWVMLAIFSTFAADTAAFFIGRAWGRHALSPSISPGKTWEGAISGFLAAIIAAVLLSRVAGLSASYTHVLIIGGLVGVFGQFGDLAESLLKRSAGVKDAGSLIPGHGGMLDRLDSVVFSVVVVYYYVIWAAV